MAYEGGGQNEEVNWLTEEICAEATIQKDMQADLERDVNLSVAPFAEL